MYRHMVSGEGIHDRWPSSSSGKASGDSSCSSDGLSDMVEDPHIEETLASELSLEEKADRLVRNACDAGGHDNVTVVLGLVLQVE
jgi:hypothetical protein